MTPLCSFLTSMSLLVFREERESLLVFSVLTQVWVKSVRLKSCGLVFSGKREKCRVSSDQIRLFRWSSGVGEFAFGHGR